MSSLVPIIAGLHLIGAIIGTFFTTYAELFYLKAAADGKIDHHERKYLRHIFRSLKWGMSIIVITGIALMVLVYLVPGATGFVHPDAFWFVLFLTAFIIIISVFLSRKQSPWWFASAALLSAWWSILLIDFGIFNPFSFITLCIFYFLFLFVTAGKLALLRLYVWKPQLPHHPPTE